MEIDAAIPHTWSELLPVQTYDLTRGWWGYFETDSRPLMAMHDSCIFLVDSDGHMHFSHHSASPEDLQWTRIRVVGRLGRKCMVGP